MIESINRFSWVKGNFQSEDEMDGGTIVEIGLVSLSFSDYITKN